MITNIVDRRKRGYRWNKITAIVEPTRHDNSCKDSDQCDQEELWFGYDELAETSLEEAIVWANEKPGKNTLFLYDLGCGISEVNPEEVESAQAKGMLADLKKHDAHDI